ncbi:rhodanese-like domain-containing protein [Amphibiibacter pelophylacis]|uniref:Rhodanese-like domain-containing protein n=1 Tax=Amphibiibacter pelophylacis TaxID=1799477 RepID=A0ACC6P0B2_9BURK
MDFILQNWYWIVAAAVSGSMLLWPTLSGAARGVSASEAVLLINRQKAVVLDVRSEEDYLAGHIVGSRRLDPSADLEASGLLPKDKDRPVLLVCQTGTRSRPVVGRISKLGYTQVSTLSGGLKAWTEASMPLEQGAPAPAIKGNRPGKAAR